MANDLDQLPLYDALIKENSLKMSDKWVNSLSSFLQNLTGYLTQNGILLPNLTTVQRDSIQTPQVGQMIYNTTLNTAQYYKAGVWTSF